MVWIIFRSESSIISRFCIFAQIQLTRFNIHEPFLPHWTANSYIFKAGKSRRIYVLLRRYYHFIICYRSILFSNFKSASWNDRLVINCCTIISNRLIVFHCFQMTDALPEKCHVIWFSWTWKSFRRLIITFYSYNIEGCLLKFTMSY